MSRLIVSALTSVTPPQQWRFGGFSLLFFPPKGQERRRSLGGTEISASAGSGHLFAPIAEVRPPIVTSTTPVRTERNEHLYLFQFEAPAALEDANPTQPAPKRSLTYTPVAWQHGSFASICSSLSHWGEGVGGVGGALSVRFFVQR